MTRQGRINFGSNAWLIAYDIADHRRLGRVYRVMKKHGMPIQYSVFLAWLDNNQIDALVSQLRECINEREDDVRLYHLPATTDMNTLGRQWLPDGVHLYQAGTTLLVPTKGVQPDDESVSGRCMI